MYIIYSIIAAFTSSLATIYAKKTINKSNYLVLITIRTFIIFLISIFINIIFKINININININDIIYIIISGIFTALLWIFYFKALSLSNISLVVPVDKLGVIITLLLSGIFFKEKITIFKIISTILIIIGTYIMVNKHKKIYNKWYIYALLSALFNSLITISSKIYINNINIYLSISIKTFTILIILLIINKIKNIKFNIKIKYKYIILSSITTILSWIFYFKALTDNNILIVYSLEKLNIIFTILLSKEKLNKKKIIGLVLILTGEILLII